MTGQSFPHNKGHLFQMLIPSGWRKQGFIIAKPLSIKPKNRTSFFHPPFLTVLSVSKDLHSLSIH